MEVLSKSLAETKAVASVFLDFLVEPSEKGKKSSATIVGLHGDLGSGKTTFTQAIAKTLGVEERVTSPTFVIMKNYRISCQGLPLTQGKGNPFYLWKRLIHIDAYRLDKAEELKKLNWSELISDPINLILIEWPERVAEILPPDLISINFKFIDEATRQISYEEI